jgi:hypothetical protein
MTTTKIRNHWQDTGSRPARWAAFRDEMRARRSARAARLQLRQDLASYTTQSELDDLSAVLDRYEGEDVDEIRAILSAQRNRAA